MADIRVSNLPRVGRKTRRPTHSFQIRSRPWQVQPFLIAPVLPGETMKNLLLQARVVSDPVVHPLVGWWTEFYFFYVKLRDLADRDVITDMLVTGQVDQMANHPADVKRYHHDGYDYVGACLDSVVTAYFRDEGDEPSDYMIDGLPAAQIGVQSWMDSALLDSSVRQPGETWPGEGRVLPDGYEQFSDQYAHWEAMRSMALTTVDFEDWLRTFGVKVPKAEQTDPHIPELLRYVRDWTYPSNTVDPATGAPTSALSWSVAERADKDRFFAEPGFVFGCSVTRPKVYYGKQRGNLSSHLNTPFSWLPAVLQSQPYTSLMKIAQTQGPLEGIGEDYWIDVRDLFMHGDQFVNFARDGGDGSFVALPDANIQKKFPSEADALGLFKDQGVNAVRNLIRMDGRVDINILSRLEDTSLTGAASGVVVGGGGGPGPIG